MPNPAAPAMERTATPGIFKRGGRYVVVFRDPTGRQRKRFARTLSEARNVKAELNADVTRGEYRQTSRVTFAEYAETWLETYRGRTSRGVRASTMREYKRDVEVRAVTFFGRQRLSSITPMDVKRFLAGLHAAKCSASSVRRIFAPVRALFATAVEEGLIRSNPAAGVRVSSAPTSGDEDGEKRKALTEDELGALIAETTDADRLVVRFLGATGLRVGEAIALRFSDIDFGRRSVDVRRAWRQGVFSPPKSRYGRRTVPLSPGLARDLWELRKNARSDDELVFPGRRGVVMHPSTVHRAVRSAGKKTGVPWVTTHTLRHTAASAFFRHGLNARQVQTILGHHSPAFTLQTYVHLLEGDMPDLAFMDDVVGVGVDAASRAGRVPGRPSRAQAGDRGSGLEPRTDARTSR